MTRPARTIATGIGFVLATCGFAVVGYKSAGWGWVDSFYMVVITVFGVGYGEVNDLSERPGLRLFTAAVILVCTTSGLYLIGGVVQALAEGQVNHLLGRRRMTKGIERLTDHTIVCGYGRVGKILCDELSEAGTPFVIVDNDESRLAPAEEAGLLVVLGDATVEETLIAAGVMRARTLATVLPDDALNVFITLTACGVSPAVRVIARAENPASEKKLRRSGADRVVLPARIGAGKIAALITRPSAEDLLTHAESRADLRDELARIGLKMNEFTLEPGSDLVGATLSEVEAAGGIGFLVVALHRHAADGGAAEEVLRRPSGDSILAAGDALIVLGYDAALPTLARKAKTEHGMVYRGTRSS
ncbi:potassium channel family protein [Alienimonas chondri]|uniref:Glutathione-regulated potassium-efflux system protein KefC n=1 Tax=Alienimonas chondri TaxID=2681879 RepID=A0ABX1VFL2_9PLAN|nr:potassium channel protein [Alienimonas chondri]NNJ26524.1 Glutathione-regulated potassium-efflux system protein KefC [Alienimonas chondri]